MFSGLVFCADCKAKMRYCTTNYFEERQDHFVCANYRSNTGTYSAHFIRAVVLEQLVWKHMQMVIEIVARHEAYFRSVMDHQLRLESEELLRVKRKQLEKADKRFKELDRLFIRLYEDNVAGKLNDERFSSISRNYEDEQETLKEAAGKLSRISCITLACTVWFTAALHILQILLISSLTDNQFRVEPPITQVLFLLMVLLLSRLLSENKELRDDNSMFI